MFPTWTYWRTNNRNICFYISYIFKENELSPISTVREYLTTALDGKNYLTRYYNLDVIISVGYRVKSLRGTQFRIVLKRGCLQLYWLFFLCCR
ncbi:MAG: virulence RhuM family protein [Bacteroidales bacterium]|nr:virulence RhuM family protein [Bacteroidales bacterium]